MGEAHPAADSDRLTRGSLHEICTQSGLSGHDNIADIKGLRQSAANETVHETCCDDRVIDLPPEQVIEQRLVKCGLNPLGVSVIYEEYLQSIEVVIKPEAEATSEQFGCIHEAAAPQIVTFSDPDMYRRYTNFVAELLRPEMLENLRQALEKIGRLANFPVRSAYGSDKLFAEAIEVHCGVPKGRALKEFGDGIAYMPPQEDYRNVDKFSAMYDCLSTAIAYVAVKGELSVGLIGNEAFREENST